MMGEKNIQPQSMRKTQLPAARSSCRCDAPRVGKRFCCVSKTQHDAFAEQFARQALHYRYATDALSSPSGNPRVLPPNSHSRVRNGSYSFLGAGKIAPNPPNDISQGQTEMLGFSDLFSSQPVAGMFADTGIRYRNALKSAVNEFSSARRPQTSLTTLRQVHQLRLALEAIRPGRLSGLGTIRTRGSLQFASVGSAIDFGSSFPTYIKSIEEINTAPTSFTPFGPAWQGSTATAPWSGPGSTAAATVGGVYNGSNGNGTLKFQVTRDGTHGQNDLTIKVYDSDDNFVEAINIKKNDPLNQVYQLGNGLSLTLGEGAVVKNEFFTVNTQLLSTSYSPIDPVWSGSTAEATIGGTYDGSNGTGQLRFVVSREGTHGVDDLRIQVFAPDDSLVETVKINDNDPVDKVYQLSNGLSLQLSAGDLIKNESFVVNVDENDPGATGPTTPPWQLSSAAVTIGGEYNGANGSDTLTFQVARGGEHGQDDLKLKVYDSDNNLVETINIRDNDPIDQVYQLGNGLTLSLGAGDLIKNETFTLDVEASAQFSTDPHPVRSTAVVTLGGVYDGSNDTGTLTFQVAQGGIHGVDDLLLNVYDDNDVLLDTINVGAGDPMDRQYQLSNGLTFSLNAGKLVADETFVVDVNHQIGSRVDPDNPFDGIRNSNPNFDSGLSVTNGSFNVNGVAISVFASDSINTVLDRINQADLDITATFDTASESIVLTRNTPGANHSIELTDDTSGFLAATKLAGAEAVIGGGDQFTPLSQIAGMESVTSGTIRINGHAVSIDVENDSLHDIIGRINALPTAVTATLDTDNNTLLIAATDPADLVIDSGDTGFFAAVGIEDGNYESVGSEMTVRKRIGYSSQIRRRVTHAVRDFAKRLNDLFDESQAWRHGDQFLAEIRHEIQAAVAGSFETPESQLKTDLGIAFDFSRNRNPVLRFGNDQGRQLTSALRSTEGAREFADFFFGTEQMEGLADRLQSLLEASEKRLVRELGPSGHVIDVVV